MKRVVANDAASIFLLANIVSDTMEVGVCNRIMQKSTNFMPGQQNLVISMAHYELADIYCQGGDI
jgi:hypothetical protein